MDRSGGLQIQKVIQLCFSGKFTEPQLWNLLNREGGVFSYLGTKDLREVEQRIGAGDSQATIIFDAMIYQTAKDIGAMATVLNGRVDALLLTGGMARSQKLVHQLCEAIQWIAPVTVYPGEDELQALAEGALRVLRGEEQARELQGGQ
jgi:butyrate kinase